MKYTNSHFDLRFLDSVPLAKHPSVYFLDIIKSSGLTNIINNVSFVSRELGISRKGYYDFIHGSTGISPLMAVRLASFFKKYIPDHSFACDYNFWWEIHSKWTFQNELGKLCKGEKSQPYKASEKHILTVAEEENQCNS